MVSTHSVPSIRDFALRSSRTMWRRLSVRSHRRLAGCRLSTACLGGETLVAPVKLYVIAGEASGDAIGAKVIRALKRHESLQSLDFRGIGGPQMCEVGGFESLFPMQELSVMGLVEVVPYLWRFRRRIHDTLRDIEEFQPELVLTIDSKGFTFRVLKALEASEKKSGTKRIKKAHYVAPSVWAYKHRGKRDFTELKQLLDLMFTILPFEEGIFREGDLNQGSWCQFVGHPAVEDFLEAHGVYEGAQSGKELSVVTKYLDAVEVGTDALLDLSKYDLGRLLARGQLLQELAANGREPSTRAQVREDFELPLDAFVICALVGSRSNEVKKSSQLVIEAIEDFKHKSNMCGDDQIYVVFPTIAAVKEEVEAHISAMAPGVHYCVLTDLDAGARLRLFQSADLAVAVSGTIVLETTLANLPTVVIYRANKLTEWIAQRLAAVRFVSVPNLLLGRPLLPELLFSECTAPKIADALATLHQNPLGQHDVLQLAMAVSTLTNWRETNMDTKRNPQPIQTSDLVAEHIFKVLADK